MSQDSEASLGALGFRGLGFRRDPSLKVIPALVAGGQQGIMGMQPLCIVYSVFPY